LLKVDEERGGEEGKRNRSERVDCGFMKEQLLKTLI